MKTPQKIRKSKTDKLPNTASGNKTRSLFVDSKKTTKRTITLSNRSSARSGISSSSNSFYGFKFKFNDEIEQFDFNNFEPTNFGSFLTIREVERCNDLIKKKLSTKLYSKSYQTSNLAYCMVFTAAIVLSALCIVYIMSTEENSDDSGVNESAILKSIAATMVCLIIGCVLASWLYGRTDRLTKKRLNLLKEVENELNEVSLKQKNNASYKFAKEGDVLLVWPRDIELLEEQLTSKLIKYDRSYPTTNSNSKREQNHDTLSLDFDKNKAPQPSHSRNNSDSVNINLHAMDDISSIYDVEIGSSADRDDSTGISRQPIKTIKTKGSRLSGRHVHPDVKKVALLDLYKVQQNDGMLSIITEEDPKTKRTIDPNSARK
jgi:hypothetical protein